MEGDFGEKRINYYCLTIGICVLGNKKYKKITS